MAVDSHNSKNKKLVNLKCKTVHYCNMSSQPPSNSAVSDRLAHVLPDPRWADPDAWLTLQPCFSVPTFLSFFRILPSWHRPGGAVTGSQNSVTPNSCAATFWDDICMPDLQNIGALRCILMCFSAARGCRLRQCSLLLFSNDN